MLDYLNNVAGQADIVIVFDGRCRPLRRTIEDHLCKGDKTIPEELWVTYKQPPRSAGHEVFMGSELHEMACVRLPTGRNRVATKPRQMFLPEGASSTHSKTFTNVSLPTRARLPRISKRRSHWSSQALLSSRLHLAH